MFPYVLPHWKKYIFENPHKSVHELLSDRYWTLDVPWTSLSTMHELNRILHSQAVNKQRK